MSPTRVLVQQPQFLPWAGYWHKVWSADLNVLYAGVQFEKGGHQNRVQLFDKWLTVPVVHKYGQAIKDVVIKREECPKIARRLKESLYLKQYEFRDRLLDLLKLFESWQGNYLLDLQVKTYELMAKAMYVTTKFVVDDKVREGTKHEKLQGLFEDHDLMDVVFLSGRAGQGFGYDKIPQVNWVEYQTVDAWTEEDSMLRRMVSDRYPLCYVTKIGGWCEGTA